VIDVAQGPPDRPRALVGEKRKLPSKKAGSQGTRGRIGGRPVLFAGGRGPRHRQGKKKRGEKGESYRLDVKACLLPDLEERNGRCLYPYVAEKKKDTVAFEGSTYDHHSSLEA